MDSIRYLVTKYYFNERTYSTTTVASQQFYPLPPNVKKLINLNVVIGGVTWVAKECPTRDMWDTLNVINFVQDFPSYFFVYNGQVGIYPNPATSGNTINMHFKTRIIDLSQADVTNATASATMSATNGTIPVVASTGTFLNWMEGNWMRIPFSSTNATSGDNQWYQIDSVVSATQAYLMNPYQGNTVSGANFTIGEMSILPEDYQDLPLYRMASIYYTTRFPDIARAKEYQELYDRGVAALDAEFGSKTTNVSIPDTPDAIVNPNLFISSSSQTNP